MDSAELDALWDFGSPIASEKRFRQVGTPEAMTQVARTLGLQGKHGDAHKLLDDLVADSPITTVRIALERGRLHNDLKENEEALRCFQEAKRLAEEAGSDYYEVDAAHMIAICTNSVEDHRIAIDLAKSSSDERAQKWDASLLNNLGWTLFKKGDLEDALQCFQDAYERRKSRVEDRTHVAKWCVARCLREMGRIDEALEMQYELLEGPQDGYVYHEIGACHLAKGNVEGSRPYFEEAVWLLPNDDKETNHSRAVLGRAGRFAEITPDSITLKRAFHAPNELLWQMIGTRDGWANWLGNPQTENLAIDKEFDLWIDGDKEDIVQCRITGFEPKRQIRFAWGDKSEVTISIVESALTLTHKGIDDLAVYGAAWHSAIDLLSHAMAGGSKKTFTENYDALLPEYKKLIERTLNPKTQ